MGKPGQKTYSSIEYQQRKENARKERTEDRIALKKKGKDRATKNAELASTRGHDLQGKGHAGALRKQSRKRRNKRPTKNLAYLTPDAHLLKRIFERE